MSRVEITEHHGTTFLWIDGKMWMWDLPEEIETQREIAEQAYGNVMVAGYGLGIVQNFLSSGWNTKVKYVLTVEKEWEVLTACQEHFGSLHGITICFDFYDFIPSMIKRNPIEKYDCVIGDIWSEIHPHGLEQYKKFREKAQTLLKSGGKILAWGQEYYEYLILCEQTKRKSKKELTRIFGVEER